MTIKKYKPVETGAIGTWLDELNACVALLTGLRLLAIKTGQDVENYAPIMAGFSYATSIAKELGKFLKDESDGAAGNSSDGVDVE